MSAIREFDQQIDLEHSHVAIPASAGRMHVNIIKPQSYGPHPVVVLLMGMFGIDQSLCSTARLIAEQGYAVLVPDLYHHLAGEYSEDGSDNLSSLNVNSSFVPEDFDEALEVMRLVSDERCLADINSVLELIKQRRDLDESKVMSMGVCIGGKWSLLSGCYFPEKLCCVSSYYVSGLESCSYALSNLKVPGQLVVAGKSMFAGKRAINRIEALARDNKNHFEILHYDNSDHNFLDASGRSFDPVTAVDALQKTCRFFSEFARVA
jgi:carboxymethylenebutenolidase